MSEVRLVIQDAERAIYADRHGSDADRVIAALCDEPETIGELEAALRRFMAPDDTDFFRGFSSGMDDRPHDAGLVVIDLAARLVVCDSTYSSASREGHVRYRDATSKTDIDLPYHLSDDWHILNDACDWHALAERRRRERLAESPLDARAVLYGNALIEFIVAGCFDAFRDRATLAKPDYQDPAYQEECDLIRQDHARWMMTPRDDLRGQTPRQVMLARHGYISWSLQDREEQWSMTHRCPPGLDPESSAYRFAGFGTHEMVVYYDLIRSLFWCCRHDLWDWMRERDEAEATADAFLACESPRLAEDCELWLDGPEPEFGGRTPRSLIHNERARIPEGMSGHEAIVDPDCPLCQMMAESPGPAFWSLDGCNMDEDFAFSMRHDTYEEWEKEQQEQEEDARRWQQKLEERKRLGLDPDQGEGAFTGSVWTSSYTADQSPNAPVVMRLFAIGTHLTEIIVDLKEPVEQRDLIDLLSRTFGNLREVCQSPQPVADALTEPVLTAFCDALTDTAAARPDLAPKCEDLQRRARRLFDPDAETGFEDGFIDEEDVPF